MWRIGICSALLALLSAFAMPIPPAQTTYAENRLKPEEKFSSSLSKEIHHQLLLLPFYSVFDSIAFTLDGNKVTLTGEVVRPTLKDHAEAAVKSIEGVDTVNNRIEVLPISPADDELRSAIYRAIFEEPALARYAVQAVPAIHIIVKNGNVTLAGSIGSESDKKLATLRAGSIGGVLAVKNNLVVQPKGGAAE